MPASEQFLSGKVAVITGSTRGLGLAIAQTYAEAGATIVITSRTASAVANTVEEMQLNGYQASGLVCNVGDPNQIEDLANHALETFGRLDIWVNNAGLGAPYGPSIHVPPERFVRVINANILGTYHGSRAAMRHFLAQDSGKLINILGRGDHRFVAMQNAYATSKAWTRNFTLAMAKEYEDSGVGVYAFNPGLVDTDMLRNIDVIQGHEERVKPLKYVILLWSDPPEVPAKKALWLASPATDGRTGLEVNLLGPGAMMSGIVRAGWRWLTRQNKGFQDLTVHTILPAEDLER